MFGAPLMAGLGNGVTYAALPGTTERNFDFGKNS